MKRVVGAPAAAVSGKTAEPMIGALVVGVLVLFVGVDVAAFVVELHFAALLAHVDLEFPRGAAAFGAVPGVAHAKELLTEAEAETLAGCEPQIEITRKAATEIKQCHERVAETQQQSEVDDNVDGDHVLRLQADRERNQPEFEIAEAHAEHDQDGERTDRPAPAATIAGLRWRMPLRVMRDASTAPPMAEVK